MQHEVILDNQSIFIRANEDTRRISFRSSKIFVRVDTENKEVRTEIYEN